jgi:hypothetical protein
MSARSEEEMWGQIKKKLDSLKRNTAERIHWIEQLQAKGCHPKLIGRARKYSYQLHETMMKQPVDGKISRDLDGFLFGDEADDQEIH